MMDASNYTDEVENALEKLSEMLFQVHMTFYMNGVFMPRQLLMENVTFEELQGFVDLMSKNQWDDALTLNLVQLEMCFVIDDYSGNVCVFGIEKMVAQ